jgi:predicted glycoside hydrolase/deacetylase ChbG (UPF0249 family)
MGVNYAIIDSFLAGGLTSTTIMAAMPGFEHAVMLAKQHTGLGVGIHLTLTCGYPVLTNHSTIVDATGKFKRLSFYEEESSDIEDIEIYKEWKAQIEKVYASGIKPTHLDSHHHVHTLKNNVMIIKRLAKEYHLPIRNSFMSAHILHDEGIVCNDILIDPWGGQLKGIDNVPALLKEVRRLLDDVKNNYDVIEVMWHPAYLDHALISGSSFSYPRMLECEVIKNQELIEYMKKNFILCTFQDI